MVMTACGERPFSRQTSEKIWNKITYTAKILPTFHYLPWFSEFYLVFKGLPSIGQNQFWRDELKMWMKASIGFCPQRADLILLTDEVRGRAGFLRPRESRPTKMVRRLIFITLEERFKTWVTNILLELLFNKKTCKRVCLGQTPFLLPLFLANKALQLCFLGQKMPSLAIFVLLTFHLTNIVWTLCSVWLWTGWYPF